MSNSLTYFSPQIWSARVQILLKNNLVGAAVSNTEERASLNYGYRVHRPYHSEVYADDYTKGTTPTILDVSATDEYLDVDQAKIIPLYLDDIDKIQNKYATMDLLSERSAYQLRDTIDKKVLAEVSNAALGNSTAITLATNNVAQSFSEAKASLFNNGVEENKPWFAVVTPDTVSIIEQYFASNGFRRQDETMDGGYGLASYLGEWLGLKMFKSQNVPHSIDIVYSDDPTTTTTLIINGVTFTFLASIGTTAGAVLIDGGSDVDVTIGTNLVAAINGTTAGTKYYPLSDANRAKLKRANVYASYVAGTNTLTITAGGKMTIAGTQDTATVGTQTNTSIIGQMGCIDLVLQSDVRAEFKRDPYKPGTHIQTWALYGVKTFNEGAQRMYKLYLNA